MAKRAINWVEIKTRFLAGERPVDIAKDFRSCTAASISTKASREKWVQERERILETVTEKAEIAITAEVVERSISVARTLRHSAETAAILEKELLDAQLILIRKGREFIDFLEAVIPTVAIDEATSPDEIKPIIKELRNAYQTLFNKMLPAKLVASAFATARAESDLVADEEFEREREKSGGSKKKEGMKFVLNIKKQTDILNERVIEDND